MFEAADWIFSIEYIGDRYDGFVFSGTVPEAVAKKMEIERQPGVVSVVLALW